ncbi:hypothetical protein pb186bvf_016450 [Paramecium bursaria]
MISDFYMIRIQSQITKQNEEELQFQQLLRYQGNNKIFLNNIVLLIIWKKSIILNIDL